MGNLSPCLDTGEGQIEEAGEKLGILHFYFSSLWFLQCSIYPFSCKNVFMAVKKKKKKKGFRIVKAGEVQVAPNTAWHCCTAFPAKF